MIDITVADFRKSGEAMRGDEVIRLLDGRKKESIGYFIPTALYGYVKSAIEEAEKSKKAKLLAKIAEAQSKDEIGDAAVSDGLE
ncbi:MAG TPA: hypothetical protein PLV58_06455 [Campylobacterales bacterium]|nr:hypothetical protein [Campylobacterales bacterium]